MISLSTEKLPPKQPEDQAQDDADQNAGPQGEVKGEILPRDDEIPRQLPEAGNLGDQQQRQPHHYQEDAEDDEDTGEVGHLVPLARGLICQYSNAQPWDLKDNFFSVELSGPPLAVR